MLNKNNEKRKEEKKNTNMTLNLLLKHFCLRSIDIILGLLMEFNELNMHLNPGKLSDFRLLPHFWFSLS